MNVSRKAAAVIAFIIILGGLGSALGNPQDKKKKKENKSIQFPVARPTPSQIAPVATIAPAPKANGSLFSSTGNGNDLFSDFKPRHVGDLVFVDVVEANSASVAATASRSRDSGTIGGLVGAIAAVPVSGAGVVSSVVSGLGTRKYAGAGATDRKTTLKARIAARVVEVLPNGDLRIEAQKSVNINKENERLSLSGVVRVRDVSSENAIPTTSIGDLFVELNGKGVASADNAPGWLFRLFDKISPF